MNLSAHDERLLYRFLDGALAGAELAAVQQRLAAEPALQRALDGLREQQRAFATAGSLSAGRSGGGAPAGFTAGVLAAARRLPTRLELREAEQGDRLLQMCRRLLIAAAILFGVGLAWQFGVVGGSRADTLQAAPDDVRREMERLDGLIQGGATGAAGAAAPADRRPQ